MTGPLPAPAIQAFEEPYKLHDVPCRVQNHILHGLSGNAQKAKFLQGCRETEGRALSASLLSVLSLDSQLSKLLSREQLFFQQ